MSKRLYFLLVISLLSLTDVVAQELSFEAYAGAMNYQGDLVDGIVEIKETQLAFGAGFKYQMFSDISIRGSVILGKISGDDLNSERFTDRGYSFENKITEMTVAVEYHPLGRGRWNLRNELIKNISPYVYGGAGYMFGDPTVMGLPPSSEDLADETTSRLVIPFGIGVQATFNESYYIGIEAGTRYLGDDYIDGVSIEGNPGANDWYLTGGIKVGFFLSGEPSMF